jgi:hypothetical protein
VETNAANVVDICKTGYYIVKFVKSSVISGRNWFTKQQNIMIDGWF